VLYATPVVAWCPCGNRSSMRPISLLLRQLVGFRDRYSAMQWLFDAIAIKNDYHVGQRFDHCGTVQSSVYLPANHGRFRSPSAYCRLTVCRVWITDSCFYLFLYLCELVTLTSVYCSFLILMFDTTCIWPKPFQELLKVLAWTIALHVVSNGCDLVEKGVQQIY
jgi:hypothetical protein